MTSDRHLLHPTLTVGRSYKARMRFVSSVSPYQIMPSQLTAHPSDIPLNNLYNLLQPITVPSKQTRFTNWARSFTCTPTAIFEPENEFQCELVLELARREGKTVRVAGVGHSPNDLPCTSQYMLRTTKLNRILEVTTSSHLLRVMFWSSYVLSQVNTEKLYVVAQAGITLNELHAQLSKNNLAMTNVGSISEQTLGGVITTATHGSGITYGVLSTQVRALSLLLADGSRTSCSRTERPDLFLATICGLGATGIILSVQLDVEPMFRLKEMQRSLSFDEVVQNFDHHVNSAEHVRFWWFPTMDIMRCSYSNRTNEVKNFYSLYTQLKKKNFLKAPNPAGSWLWHSLMGYHVIQFLLFLGRYFLFLNTYIANFACWLASGDSLGIDDSYRIFNVDCRVSLCDKTAKNTSWILTNFFFLSYIYI